jgi:hypothetical protein
MRALFPLSVILLAGCQLLLPGSADPTVAEAAPTIPEVVALNDPEIGVEYEFTVYTHCGLDTATIDGEIWLFEGEPGVNPPPGFRNPMDAGTIVFIDEDHAVFTSSGGVDIGLTRGGEPRKKGGCA